MITGKNIIAGKESALGNDSFNAFDPVNITELEESFTDATVGEVNSAFTHAVKAFREYRKWSGSRKSALLNSIADDLDNERNEIIKRAGSETGLPEARLNNEMNRTCNQIRMFANLVLEGSWVEASIDTAVPDRPGAPKPDIRRMLQAIGPVVVFGASNFPLAFSVAGGDTASALAAGNPVLVKAHPSHPGTSELVARVIQKAIKKNDAPEGLFALLIGKSTRVGQSMVKHPYAKAVAFTGSFAGGKALYDLAQQREEPIPVFAEMGSLNPIFLFDEKLRTDTKHVAELIASSVNLGAGQFCTKPGLVIMNENDSTDELVRVLKKEFSEKEEQVLLNEGIHNRYNESVKYLNTYTDVEIIYAAENDKKLRGRPVLALATAEQFLENPSLHNEVFGPYTLLVKYRDQNELNEIAEKLEGQLSVTVFSTETEIDGYCDTIEILEEKTGRIIFNQVPTGLEVCPSTQHGGPFPATTDSRFTSVGTAAIKRFARPVAYQNWPHDLLPVELRDDNPLSIARLVDNHWYV